MDHAADKGGSSSVLAKKVGLSFAMPAHGGKAHILWLLWCSLSFSVIIVASWMRASCNVGNQPPHLPLIWRRASKNLATALNVKQVLQFWLYLVLRNFIWSLSNSLCYKFSDLIGKWEMCWLVIRWDLSPSEVSTLQPATVTSSKRIRSGHHLTLIRTTNAIRLWGSAWTSFYKVFFYLKIY